MPVSPFVASLCRRLHGRVVDAARGAGNGQHLHVEGHGMYDLPLTKRGDTMYRTLRAPRRCFLDNLAELMVTFWRRVANDAVAGVRGSQLAA
ncbi:hypothetical protein V494_06412 [Pseudogymnoascus sp. VKM F-4513 (FW-928)]|nr:hypothetical protein V494_06412 [Pseudogymnoascus sp. VKM F-4513 (FW-928)]